MQVTRPTSAAAAAAAASKPSPPKDSKDAKDKASSSPEGKEGSNGPEVPPVSTLLEFVAWVVLTQHPLGTKAVEDWSKGRGGYLMDELDQVKEASVRVQVMSSLVASQFQPEHLAHILYGFVTGDANGKVELELILTGVGHHDVV